jgi:hypothetical protein
MPKYFKLITRIEHADLDETRGKGEGETIQNTMKITDIDGCQKKRLVEIFKPLVAENAEMLLDVARQAL